MFKRLIVPLDGTPESAVALPAARAFARATGATISLVRVVKRDEPERRQEALTYLERISAELAGDNLQVPVSVLTGEPWQEVLSEAQAQQADLIVMSTHGRSGVGRVLLGSVAEHLLGRSAIPMMLLRPGGERMTQVKRLLVPVDGTPGGAIAMGAAFDLARATGAKLLLLQVVVPVPAYAYDAASGVGFGGYLGDGIWDEEAKAAAQVYVDGLVARLQKAGVSAAGYARIGQIPETIVAVSDEQVADLIVMSTHGLTGPARAILGSVADAVARTSMCPVLLVRQKAPVVVQEDEKATGEPLWLPARRAESHTMWPA